MNLAKPSRIENKKLLAEIRSLNCTACGKRGSEAHHVTTKGSGGGDVPNNLMPLCRQHHAEIHQYGAVKMGEKYISVKNWLKSHGRDDILGRGI